MRLYLSIIILIVLLMQASFCAAANFNSFTKGEQAFDFDLKGFGTTHDTINNDNDYNIYGNFSSTPSLGIDLSYAYAFENNWALRAMYGNFNCTAINPNLSSIQLLSWPAYYAEVDVLYKATPWLNLFLGQVFSENAVDIHNPSQTNPPIHSSAFRTLVGVELKAPLYRQLFAIADAHVSTSTLNCNLALAYNLNTHIAIDIGANYNKLSNLCQYLSPTLGLELRY